MMTRKEVESLLWKGRRFEYARGSCAYLAYVNGNDAWALDYDYGGVSFRSLSAVPEPLLHEMENVASLSDWRLQS